MRTPFASLGARRSSIENPSTSWDSVFTDYVKTSAGVSLPDDKAATVPDVFACIQVLSQDVGRCPLKLRRIDGKDGHVDATEHPMWEILADLPNPEMTAFEFRQAMQTNLLTYRRAYAEIVRNQRNEIVSLWVLDPRYMKVSRNALNQKVWTYRAPNQREIVWTFHPSMPPIFELSHASPIDRCRDLIGLAYALDMFGAKFFANGARPSGTLEAPQGIPVTDEQKNTLRRSFMEMFSGAENAGKVAFLTNGLKFNPMTIANNEAQYIETRKFIRTLIAGVFRMPPHKIGDLERATFSNIEQQSIDYVTGTLDPFLVAWEQAIRRDLLTTRQFPGYIAMFDRQALIKADIQSLINALAVGRQNGWWNADEIRRRLGDNPIGGDVGTAYLVNGNMTPADVAANPADPAPEPAQPDPAAMQAEANAQQALAEVRALAAARQPIEVHAAPVTVTTPPVTVDVHLPGPVAMKRTFKRNRKSGLVEEEMTTPATETA